MSDIVVTSQTQQISVTPQTASITVDPVTSTIVEIVEPTSSVSVISAGPQGPPGIPGLSGETDTAALLAEVDSKVAAHAQATPVHSNATSGRDFVAFFENGLI